MKKISQAASLLVLLLLLAACQHRVPEVKEQAPWLTDQTFSKSQQQQSLSHSKAWTYKAKVGVRSASFSEQASLNWQALEHQQRLKLYGPFGAGAVTLKITADGAELTDKNGQTHSGYSAEHLLYKLLGWPLPVEALSSWVFGVPAEAPYQYRLNQQQNLAELKQLGWHIEYKSYADYQGYYLPKLLVAKKQFSDPQLGEMTVKVVTKRFIDGGEGDAKNH